jgi:phage gpG-like protein
MAGKMKMETIDWGSVPNDIQPIWLALARETATGIRKSLAESETKPSLNPKTIAQKERFKGLWGSPGIPLVRTGLMMNSVIAEKTKSGACVRFANNWYNSRGANSSVGSPQDVAKIHTKGGPNLPARPFFFVHDRSKKAFPNIIKRGIAGAIKRARKMETHDV